MPITLDGTNGITTPMYSGAISANAVTPSVNMKSRIINGAMVLDQRNAGASVTPSDGAYTLDRWIAETSQSSKFSVQRDAGGVTAPAGFVDYLGVTSLSAYSPVSTDYMWIGQRIEGFNVADLNFGTANAKTITVSFWVRSSLTGSFGASLSNVASRVYPFNYTISSANTWEYKTVTIPGDTSGTWNTDNSSGMRLQFNLGTGSNRLGTTSAWGSSDFRGGLTGATSVVGTNGATFYITGVQLEVGSTATSFDYRPYGTELALCQRYCFVLSATAEADFGVGACTSGGVQAMFSFPVTMRTAPSVTYSAANTLSVADGTAGYVCTSLALKNASPSQLTTNAGASGTTGGRGGLLRWNTGTATITASSEL